MRNLGNQKTPPQAVLRLRRQSGIRVTRTEASTFDAAQLVREEIRMALGEMRDSLAFEVRAIVAAAEGRGVEAGAATDPSAASYAPDPRARAILRGIEIAGEVLARSGGAYDLAQVQALLGGISRQAVDKRVREGSLLAVPGPGGARAYPTLQFNTDGSLVKGLRDVQAALPDRNPWTVLAFLAEPLERLDQRRPIDLMRAGEVDLVIEAARRLDEQGT